MEHYLDLQIATTYTPLPDEADFITWFELALKELLATQAYELTIRLVDDEESQRLNHTYRNKDQPTNVLSFPVDPALPLEIPLLGDLVICAPLVEKEAKAQNKSLKDHWAHLVIHGILHLWGYDHITDEDAEVMESLEIKLLSQLGIANPYLEA